jgi:hypothetical protein
MPAFLQNGRIYAGDKNLTAKLLKQLAQRLAMLSVQLGRQVIDQINALPAFGLAYQMALSNT